VCFDCPIGVLQRLSNKGIFWLQKNVDLSKDGVVYFADDDNTYDLELFDQVSNKMKNKTKTPIGVLQRLSIPVSLNNKPDCHGGKIEM
jgi:galactosylgalactosylxylosylprotein 3-beta-glucuronosyltransferase 3